VEGLAINVGSVFMSARLDSREFKKGINEIWTVSTQTFNAVDLLNRQAFSTAAVLEFAMVAKKNLSGVARKVEVQFERATTVIEDRFSEAKASVKDFTAGATGSLGWMASFMDTKFVRMWTWAWTAAETGFTGVWCSMSNTFTGVINRMVNGINTVLKGLNAIAINMPDWLGGGSFSFNVPLLNNIPMLARGGIVTQPTLAMIGERGKEAVLPLSNNTGWMDELAYKLSIGMAAGDGQKSGGSVVSLNIDGVMFAEAVIDDFKQVANRRGIEF